MFRGTKIVKLDEKGRIVVPTRYREIFDKQGDGLVVTGHPVGYLLLMMLHDYEEMERTVSGLPDNGVQSLYYKQTLVGKADDSIAFDKAGRVNLSPELREYAALDGEAAVVGMGKHLRIWSKQKFEELEAKCRSLGNGQMELPDGWEDFRI